MPKIIAATDEDADAIADVHVTAWQESYRGVIPQTVLDALSVAERRTAWRKIFADIQEYPIYVAEQDRQIVGFGHGGVCRSKLVGQEMEVYAIYVLERAMRQGAGSKLLRTIVGDFLSHGKTSAGLWVLRDNTIARAFYEKFGAQPVAEKIERRPGYERTEVGYAWSDLTKSFG
jgi:L-amino acid N-acyltransferase YncA